MVTIEWVKELRPKVVGNFDLKQFIYRTPAIYEAYQWGQFIHTGHLRLSGEPYFDTHCVWVAGLLDHLVSNEAYTIAGLLHDAVEDRQCSLEAIQQRFPGRLGEEVAHIVDGVTKLGTTQIGKSCEIQNLRKLITFRNPGVFLVKLADKTHNMLTLQYMPSGKRQKKAMEAIRAYGRLAGILNCYEWRRWLEDISFPYADPESFAYVKSHIDTDPRLNIDFINQMLSHLGEIMEESGVNGRINIIVDGYWQAWQKLRRMALLRKASLEDFSSINDLVSFRMLVDSSDIQPCYTLLAKVNKYFGPSLDQNRFDDYLACPQNGYRAMQVTAWLSNLGAIEVAITPQDMEAENLWGIAYAIQNDRDISAYHPLVILTPTGGIRFVPDGSTVLDAVASIQNEFLLDKISSVEVNGQTASLSDRVHAGDIVEVITGQQRFVPSDEWLKYSNPFTVRTLRSVLAAEALKRHAELGKNKVKAIILTRGLLALDDIATLERNKMDQLLEEMGCVNLEDLYTSIGGGAIRIIDFINVLDKIGISKAELKWTSIELKGASQDNHPGTLAQLINLVSLRQGNILRAVSNVLPDGGYLIHLVIENLQDKDEILLLNDFHNCPFDIKSIEIA
jgi:GTP diphosphokinase / guanosine-3',5'-bis(diphosphate) 3'-diphosphatase